MDNNNISNHICNNNHKRMERNYNLRVANEGMPRKEENTNDDRLNTHKDYCDLCVDRCKNEHGGEVYGLNVEKSAFRNRNFRESVWTGKYLQMTLMNILRGNDIGVERHEDTDQYIRVEHGNAIVITGSTEQCLDNKIRLGKGDAVLIPAGTWHNVINVGRCDLKLSSVYAPPHHPKCTVERSRGDRC